MFKIPNDIVLNFIKSEFKYKPTSNDDEIRICSFYKDDKKYKCYINTQKFQYCDFKSGVAGSAYSLFEDYLGLESNKEVLMYIMKNYSLGKDFLEWDKNNSSNIIESNNNIIEEFNANDKPIYFKQKDKIGKFGKECLKYLLDRKVSIDYIRNMGYVRNILSDFDKRIIVPYIENNEMVYFQARAVDKENALRYRNPNGLDTKNFVFNYDKINDDELIICEGLFDSMSLDEQASTCLCSGDLSSKQIKKILTKGKPKDIIFVIDQDETGFKKKDENIQRFITYADYSPNIYIYNPPSGCKDMNDVKVKLNKDFILKKECTLYNKYHWKDFNFKGEI